MSEQSRVPTHPTRVGTPATPAGAPARRARHLMDPNHPVRTVNDRTLTSVQRWVMSILAGTTIMHLSVGLIIAAWFIDDPASSYGLCVIAGAFGALAIGLGRLIHQVSPVSPWLLLGLLPAVAGVLVILER